MVRGAVSWTWEGIEKSVTARRCIKRFGSGSAGTKNGLIHPCLPGVFEVLADNGFRSRGGFKHTALKRVRRYLRGHGERILKWEEFTILPFFIFK